LNGQYLKQEQTMRQTRTITAWQAIRIGPYREAEYACDYYYENGQCVGNSGCYYTGRHR
jgi:hypothetical protein